MLTASLAILAVVVVVAAMTWPLVFGSRPQHAGSGDGVLSVWQIKDRIIREARDGYEGRHRLTDRTGPRARDAA